jgi:hypothetical protein
MALKNPGHLKCRTEFRMTSKQSSFKPIKPELSRENWDEGHPYSYMLQRNHKDNFTLNSSLSYSV